MTIRLPQPNIFDYFLRLIGKKRGIIMPMGASEKFGPHFYAKAYKENFWKALFRPRNHAQPEGLVDVFLIENIQDEVDFK